MQEFVIANKRPFFEERQHILRIKGNGSFKTLILPYHKGRKRNDLQVTQDGERIIISTANETTIVADAFYAYTNALKLALATFSNQSAGAHGLEVDGGPTEIIVEQAKATITAHGTKGLRRFKIPGDWTSVAPLSFENGEYVMDYQNDAPMRITLLKTPPELVLAGADEFVGRAPLVGAAVKARVSNLHANKQTGEPNHAGYGGGKSVWWSWTAPESGFAKIHTRGSSFDTVLAVYSGTDISSLVQVASNDDASGGTKASELRFTVVGGKTYQIALDGFDGASGTISLDVGLAVAPRLAEISSQTITNGVMLTVVNRVTNSEVLSGPPKFSLSPDAPAGTAINVDDGVFTWTPTRAQALSTNRIIVIATDSGLPELRGTNSFEVVVRRANTAPRVVPAPDQMVKEGVPINFRVGLGSFVNISSLLPGLTRNLYNGIGGDAVLNLTRSPLFPDRPTDTSVLSEFEAPSNVGDNYGQRLWGYVIPPLTGNYRFWIASDDESELRLSLDDQSSNARRIAYVRGWTGQRDWTSTTIQRSALIFLDAGEAYYIEALMKEIGGGDHLSVRWQLPDGNIEAPIPNSRLWRQDPTAAPNTVFVFGDAGLPTQELFFSLSEGAPTGAKISPSKGEFNWTPNEEQGPGVYQFSVIVTDNGNPPMSATNTFTVTVNEVNTLPVVEAVPNHTIPVFSSLSVNLSATDPDIPANPLTFTLVSGPKGMIVDSTTGKLTWIPATTGVFPVKVKVVEIPEAPEFIATEFSAAELVAYWDFETIETDGTIKSKVGPYVGKVVGGGILGDSRPGGGKGFSTRGICSLKPRARIIQ